MQGETEPLASLLARKRSALLCFPCDAAAPLLFRHLEDAFRAAARSRTPAWRRKETGERRRFDGRDANVFRKLVKNLLGGRLEAGDSSPSFSRYAPGVSSAYRGPVHVPADAWAAAEAVEPAHSRRRRWSRHDWQEGALSAKGVRQSPLRHFESGAVRQTRGELALGSFLVFRRVPSLETFLGSSSKSRFKGVCSVPFLQADRPADTRRSARGRKGWFRRNYLNKRGFRRGASTQPEHERPWRCARQRLFPRGWKGLPLSGSLTTVTEKSRRRAVGQRLPTSPSRRSMAFVNPFKEPSRRNGSPPAAGSAST